MTSYQFSWQLFGRLFNWTLLGVVLAEWVSYLGYLADPINRLMFVVIALLTLLLTIKKLEYGLYFIVAELLIGSKGYLFSWPINDFRISIRLAIFLIVMLVWAFQLLRHRKFGWIRHPLFKPMLALIAVFIYAAVVGLLNGNSSRLIFLDGNGYLFFGLFFAFIQVFQSKYHVLELMQVMTGAATATILKTLFLLVVFSQQFFPYLTPIYRWVRVTGVGEITQLPNDFYRIFFQSHLFEVFFYFLTLSLFLCVRRIELGKRLWNSIYLRFLGAGAVILISLSRSFWLGMIVGFIVVATVAIYSLKLRGLQLWFALLFLIISGLIQIGIVMGITNLPLPTRKAAVSITSLVEERTEDISAEAAGASRFALLTPLMKEILERPLWGQGFGATVTYFSLDPRVLAKNPTGSYTTYAFEWGYLDLWLKLGLVGLVVYLYYLWRMFLMGWQAWKRHIKGHPRDRALLLGSMVSFVVLLAIHATTPYLNHPLGIGWLLVLTAIFQIMRQEGEPDGTPTRV